MTTGAGQQKRSTTYNTAKISLIALARSPDHLVRRAAKAKYRARGAQRGAVEILRNVLRPRMSR